MNALIAVLASLAGGAGAMLRMLVDDAVRTRLGTRYPWGILVVNVSGSLALGVVTGLLIGQSGSSGWGDGVFTVLGAGLLGGYTTFSTATLDTVRLMRSGRFRGAFAHAVGQLVATIIAAGIGLEAGRALSRALVG